MSDNFSEIYFSTTHKESLAYNEFGLPSTVNRLRFQNFPREISEIDTAFIVYE